MVCSCGCSQFHKVSSSDGIHWVYACDRCGALYSE